ncbi:MAG: restriction endonuclease subunit S [Bacteroidia bacterium]
MKKVKLQDIVDIQIGKTPSRSNHDYWGVGFDWLSISDLSNLDNNKYISNASEQITSKAIKETGCKLIEENSVVYSFKLSIGKTAITTKSFYTNEAIAALTIKNKEELITDYLYYAMKYADVSRLTDHAAKGKTLNKKTLFKIEISLPSKEYQEKVVSVLNRAQSIIENRKNVINKTDEIIKAMFLTMFGNPVLNPNKIKKVKLSDLGDWHSGGTPPRNKSKYFIGDIPWYTSGELNDLYISSSKEKVSNEAILKTSAKLIKKHSLLIGMYDTAALKSSITTIDASSNQAIAFAKLDEDKCNVMFIYFAVQLSKDYYLNQRRGARQRNLNLSMVKKIEVPLPDIESQNIFISKAENILAIKEKANKNLHSLNILFKSILQKAFKGELQQDEIKKLVDDVFQRQILVNQINNQEFETVDQYNRAKDLLFDLLNTENSPITQVYNKKGKKIILQELTINEIITA